MPRINLLPWREELRKERQRNFAVAAAAAVLIGGAVVFTAKTMVNGQIQHQENRNQMLNKEIAALDQQIGEIRDLEEKKDRLLARIGRRRHSNPRQRTFKRQ